MKTRVNYNLSDKDVLSLTLYLSVPEIVTRFSHRGISARQIYRICKRYNLQSPAKRRKNFFNETINATDMSNEIAFPEQKRCVQQAIDSLGEKLCDDIEARARIFEEKWN